MAALASIRSRDGIYSVFGNHDLGCGNAPVSAQSKALNYWKKNKPGWDGTC